MSSTEELEHIDYSLPTNYRSRWIIITIAIFLFGVIVYFPFMYKVKSVIKNQLHSIPGCAIDYTDINLEFLLPKVVINNLQIPMSCLNQSGSPLKMDNVFVHFRGLSFYPFGPHFKIETSLEGIPLEAYLTGGIGGVAVNIRENQIELSKLKKLLPQLNLSGKVTIDAMLVSGGQSIKDFKLNIRSKDFSLPAQDIQGLKLTMMRLNSLLLKANMKNNIMNIEDFIVGDADAPVRANFKGKMTLSPRNIPSSQLDLKGEVAFSNDFLEKFAIIKLIMGKFDKKDDFYQIKLTGPLSNPNPSSSR